jgi:serine/threonine protein kinase
VPKAVERRSSFEKIGGESMIHMKKGLRLNEFVLEDQIGVGGNATVWKAVDTNLSRNVAIKRPLRKSGGTLSEQEIEDFRKEAQRGAKLIHTNIVQVYQVIPQSDDIVLVLEYVDGQSLWDDLRTRALDGTGLPLDQAMSILEGILSGLDFAHAQGICHRDLKPANILLTSSRIPKIADLGIAKVLTSSVDLHQSGASHKQGGTGTPEFMSPEQARGEDADFSSDLFMVGIIGYLLLSGKHPFAHPSGLFQINELLLDDDFSPPILKPPPNMASAESRLFREYTDIVMKLLARQRASRYSSANDASRAIQAVSPSLECPNCGSRIAETSKFCDQCGERVAANTPKMAGPFIDLQTAKELDDEGFRLSRQQQWDEAINLYRRAMAADAGFQRTYWNLGYALNHIGEYSEAIDITTRGLALPQSESRHTANLLGVRAFSYGKLKKYDGAIADLTKAVDLDGAMTQHLYSRARIYAYKGDIAAARLDARNVLLQDSVHPGALRLLAELGDGGT